LLILEEFDRLQSLAGSLNSLFESAAPVDVLRAKRAEVDDAVAKTRQMLPWPVDSGKLGQHLSFMELYLGRGDAASCAIDAKNICEDDVPGWKKAFLNTSMEVQHYDKDLAEAISPLLVTRQYDSAVRKAFVLLSARLRAQFGVSGDVDGTRLYNKVFGPDGPLADRVDGDEREALRNMLGNLSSLFRHEHAHDDVDTEWHEVETVLVVINYALRRIQQVTSDVSPGHHAVAG
jgi:hypothetical protein